jgi:hypothetical protein
VMGLEQLQRLRGESGHDVLRDRDESTGSRCLTVPAVRACVRGSACGVIGATRLRVWHSRRRRPLGRSPGHSDEAPDTRTQPRTLGRSGEVPGAGGRRQRGQGGWRQGWGRYAMVEVAELAMQLRSDRGIGSPSVRRSCGPASTGSTSSPRVAVAA